MAPVFHWQVGVQVSRCPGMTRLTHIAQAVYLTLSFITFIFALSYIYQKKWERLCIGNSTNNYYISDFVTDLTFCNKWFQPKFSLNKVLKNFSQAQFTQNRLTRFQTFQGFRKNPFVKFLVNTFPFLMVEILELNKSNYI